ncbi:unnamed protein product [Albugo candida]|uniref:Uncharacterized protein n=1 Tax=Albugo candida TaxID=65357 RepID=A0A024FZ89_9STRA|nr:unnamed protein product [Albugo candida]|eukprot:CCI39826.1 unnamed protein product [Albugo candida]
MRHVSLITIPRYSCHVKQYIKYIRCGVSPCITPAEFTCLPDLPIHIMMTSFIVTIIFAFETFSVIKYSFMRRAAFRAFITHILHLDSKNREVHPVLSIGS